MSHVVLAGGEEHHFVPPSPADFQLPPVFGHSVLFTKPFFLLVLGGIIVVVFFVMASRNASVVPSRLQFLGELGYNFTRNTIARDVIGSKDFMKFVPYLTALFFFLLVNNYFALIPFVQFPTLSLIGFVYALGAISWFVYNGSGVRRHGFLGYLKLQTMPAGIGPGMLLLIAPLEFLSNILVRPVTLTLRLWANLFAGHILLLLFAIGAEYLIVESGNPAYIPVGIMSFLLGMAVSFLEILVLALQAYIFTLLTTLYISGAVAEEH